MTGRARAAVGRRAALAAGACALLTLTACTHEGDRHQDGSFAGRPAARHDTSGDADGHADGHDGDFREGRLPDHARLVITTEGGVRVVGTGGHTVRVADGTAAHWDGEGAARTLDLPCDEGDPRARDNCGGMPLVHVPAGTALTVRARNAGIDVSEVRAPLTLTTVNGDVTVQEAGAKRSASRLVTRNGSVRATALSADRLGAETVNGDVDLLCATSPASLSGVTRNGSVRLTLPSGAPAYAADATTVNGRPTVDVPAAHGSGAGHRMTLRTVNGDVEAHRG